MENNTQVPPKSGTKKRLFLLLIKKLKYLKLTIRPAIFASVLVFVWFLLHDSWVLKKDERFFEYALAFFGGIHILIAGFQLSFASHRKQKMEQAKTLGKEEMFLEYSCIRISEEIQCILFATSLSIYILLIMYPFGTTKAGVIFTWMVVFFLCFLLECVIEMSNPYKGVSKTTDEEYEKAFKNKKKEEPKK